MDSFTKKYNYLKKEYKLSPEKLANYLTLYSSLYEDLQLGASSEATIKRILNGQVKNQDNSVDKLEVAIDKIFPINWQTMTIIEDRKSEHEYLEFRIKNLRAESDIQFEKHVAKAFEGIYLGIVNSDNEAPTPYLMTIDLFGNSEIVSVKDYHRAGHLICKELLVYFQLDTVTNYEPELYITKVDNDFKRKFSHVEEFKMCGVWVTRDLQPVYGSTLLVKQGEGSFVKDEVISVRGILPLLEDKDKDFFSKLSQTKEFNNLVERSKSERLNVHLLTHIENEPDKFFNVKK